ncbi:hypothetical protein C1645_772176 [Glomus cerebriforme]|uniref:Uncharacterized protein n=1 Tax=Glomus cerebriforme TaxID=658196 RepID=A0A397STN3_9GLOM|nr:hypothetical protein C1645_772176 [Glomus cerebriforme]
MPRADKMNRWETGELINVLKFINDNFELWYNNHHEACEEAVKALNINRDARSVYTKINNLSQFVEDKRCKPSCDDKRVRDLIKDILKKTKERRNRGYNINDNCFKTETKPIKITPNNRPPSFAEKVRRLTDEKIQQEQDKIKRIVEIESEIYRTIKDKNDMINNKFEELKKI